MMYQIDFEGNERLWDMIQLEALDREEAEYEAKARIAEIYPDLADVEITNIREMN